MVSFNVAQLLLAGPGNVREFDFDEDLPDPFDELHLRGPIRGHARLMRTSDGILVHSEHRATVSLECGRCLEEARVHVRGTLDEEFLPSADVRTGTPLELPNEGDQPRINEHHEVDLDEVLRQNILTSLPIRPLCDAACPGLCASCGQRLDRQHRAHPDAGDVSVRVEEASNPFAQLASLLNGEEER